MIKSLNVLFMLFAITSCGQNATQMKTPENASEKFAEFILKKKFYAENYSPNISDEKLRPILTHTSSGHGQGQAIT